MTPAVVLRYTERLSDGSERSTYDVGDWVMCDGPDEDGDLEYVEGAVAAFTAWRDFLKARAC